MAMFCRKLACKLKTAPEEIRISSKKPVDVHFEISMFFFLEGVNYFKRNKYFGFSLH